MELNHHTNRAASEGSCDSNSSLQEKEKDKDDAIANSKIELNKRVIICGGMVCALASLSGGTVWQV